MTATVTVNGAVVPLILQRDSDGRCRWYEASGADTEVSGRTIADAIAAARAAWPGAVKIHRS